MTIVVNGEVVKFTGSVADLVERWCGDRALAGVAVALDRAVVPRSEWEHRTVAEAQQVEIVTAVQGG